MQIIMFYTSPQGEYIYILIFYFVDCFHLPSGCVLYEVPSPEVFPRDDITELSSVTNEDC